MKQFLYYKIDRLIERLRVVQDWIAPIPKSSLNPSEVMACLKNVDLSGISQSIESSLKESSPWNDFGKQS